MCARAEGIVAGDGADFYSVACGILHYFVLFMESVWEGRTFVLVVFFRGGGVWF